MSQLFSPRANVYSRVIIFGAVILVCGAGWATSEIFWSPYTTYVAVPFDQPVPSASIGRVGATASQVANKGPEPGIVVFRSESTLLETTQFTSFSEFRKKVEILFDVTREEKLFAHCFACFAAHFVAQFFVLEELNDALGGLFNRRNKETIRAAFDLITNATDVSTDNLRALPHRFGHREAEAFTQGFLQNHRCTSL